MSNSLSFHLPACTDIATSKPRSSGSLGRKTYGTIIPQLLTQYHTSSTSSTQKQALLTSLAALIHAAASTYSTSSTSKDTRTASDDGVLVDLKDQLLGVLTAGLSLEEGRQAAMEGLMGMLGWLEKDERGYVVSQIGGLLSEDQVGDDIREHALNNLAEIAKTNPSAIELQILPSLFNSLPDQAPTLEQDDLRQLYRRTLACLGVLCAQPTLFEILNVRILSKLALLADLPEVRGEDKIYAFALLGTLEKVLRKKVANKHADVPKYADQLLPRLFTFFAQDAVDGGWGVGGEPRLIVAGGKIVELIVQSLSVECVCSLSPPFRSRALLTRLFSFTGVKIPSSRNSTQPSSTVS